MDLFEYIVMNDAMRKNNNGKNSPGCLTYVIAFLLIYVAVRILGSIASCCN